MDRLAADRMFVAVVEAGSFAGGAGRLGVSSGQASKLVAALEREIGAQLLVRTTRALSLTEVGRAYLARIRDIIADLDALDDEVRHRAGEPTGRLRVSVSSSFGVTHVAPLLMELSTRHPGLDIDASFSDRVVDLVEEGFDAAVRVGVLRDLTLVARRLTDARIVVAASPAYLAARGTPITPDDLRDHTAIIDSNFPEPKTWRFKRPDNGEPVSVPVSGRLTLSNAEACLMAAEAGLGIARVPSFMAGPRLSRSILVPLLGAWEIAPSPIHVVYPPTRHVALKVRVFVDALVERFRGRPVWDEGW